MVYNHPFLRLVVAGTLYDVDEFSWSLSFLDVQGSANPPTAVPPAVIAAVSAFHSSAGASISKMAKLTTVKLNEIGPNGKYTNPQTVRHDYTPPVAGISGENIAPQIALAISLQTPIARGRAHAGRFYLPTPAYPPSNIGSIAPSWQDNVLNSVKTLVTALNGSLAPYQLAVMSDIGSGTHQLVTGIRCGAVLDTIRSRRNKIPEAYKALPI